MRSTSVFPGSGSPNKVRIEIPLDPNRSGTVAARAARATRWLWARGVYPSPSAVNMRMRGATRDCLNGIETKARNAVLDQLNITRQRGEGLVEVSARLAATLARG
jgi:hypothetical protein